MYKHRPTYMATDFQRRHQNNKARQILSKKKKKISGIAKYLYEKNKSQTVTLPQTN